MMPQGLWWLAGLLAGWLSGLLLLLAFRRLLPGSRLASRFRRQQARYRRLLQTSDTGVVVLDSDFHVIEWSPALAGLLRLGHGQMAGMDFMTAVQPDEAAHVLTELRSHEDSSAIFETEFSLRAGDGECRPWRWRGCHFFEQQRRYLMLVGVDVTELRQTTFRLHASEARFRQVFQAAPVGMALAEPDGRVLTANQEYARFFDVARPDELVGRHLSEFVLPDDREEFGDILRSVLREGSSGYRMERRFFTASQQPRWGFARGLALDDEYGQRYLICQVADIHERKKAELALMESERRLATLIANLSGAVYRYEFAAEQAPELHHDLRFNYVSDGVEALTGYPRSVFLNARTVLELAHLIPPEDRQHLAQVLADALQGDGSFRAAYRIRHAVHGVRWVSEQGRVWQRADGMIAVDGLVQDVTSERQTRESEHIYRRLVADTETGFVSLSPLGLVLEANRPYAVMAGFTQVDDVIGRSLLAWTAPELVAQTRQFLEDAMAVSHVRHFETEYLRADGSRVSLLINAVSTSGSGGERAVKCLIFDISASKAAQRELTESRNQLAVAQRIARLGAWQWSFETQQLSVSDVFLELLDYPRDRELPTVADLQPLLVPEDAIHLRSALSRLVADDRHVFIEFRIRQNGVLRYCRADAALERNLKGRRLRLVGTVQEITEAKLAEFALRESEARYRSLFDTNLDGIFFVSLDGRIEECNRAILDMTGYRAEELCRLTTIDITPEPWQEADRRMTEQIKEKGWCEPFTKELRRADGSVFPVSLWAWLVHDDEGRPLRIMGMVRDITELRRMELEREQLQKGMRQAQKMEAIGQLAGGIAHDFNNILASILGYTDLALRREGVRQDVRLERHLQEVKLAGERARELISKMMLFSRGGRSSGTVQDISGHIQAAVRMLRPTLPATLRLRTAIHPELPPVRIEPVSLQQVVMNLVINARDAMDSRGEVQLMARMTEVLPERCASCSQPVAGDFIEVSVRDQGPGIPDAVRERIFDPFFSTKAVGQGTGMGLAVVHGIVHDAGGHLIVDSGSWGTTFRILFPVLADDVAIVTRPVSEPPREMGRGERILVVDDEVPVAGMLGELLSQHGYVVDVMTSSLAAWQHLREGQDSIDLLLTDLVMPDMDGIELVRQARALWPDLPVVMLSGQAALMTADNRPVWPVLPKPVDVAALLACMSHLLDSRRLAKDAELA